MILIVLLLQAATPAAAPATSASAAPPARFSILTPQCTQRNDHGDIVVCAGAPGNDRLPLPDDRGPPDHAVPSNPELTGIGALAAADTPCATVQSGCQVGFGPPLAPIIKGAVGAIKSAFAKKPDKRGRVAIPLDP